MLGACCAVARCRTGGLVPKFSAQLIKVLSPEQDTVFMRFYQKFAANYAITQGANHNGIRLSAKYPETTGIKPPADGTGFFLFLLQNAAMDRPGEVPPGYTDLYVYWPTLSCGHNPLFWASTAKFHGTS
jgi:hypothetical protein